MSDSIQYKSIGFQNPANRKKFHELFKEMYPDGYVFGNEKATDEKGSEEEDSWWEFGKKELKGLKDVPKSVAKGGIHGVAEIIEGGIGGTVAGFVTAPYGYLTGDYTLDLDDPNHKEYKNAYDFIEEYKKTVNPFINAENGGNQLLKDNGFVNTFFGGTGLQTHRSPEVQRKAIEGNTIISMSDMVSDWVIESSNVKTWGEVDDTYLNSFAQSIPNLAVQISLSRINPSYGMAFAGGTMFSNAYTSTKPYIEDGTMSVQDAVSISQLTGVTSWMWNAGPSHFWGKKASAKGLNQVFFNKILKKELFKNKTLSTFKGGMVEILQETGDEMNMMWGESQYRDLTYSEWSKRLKHSAFGGFLGGGMASGIITHYDNKETKKFIDEVVEVENMVLPKNMNIDDKGKITFDIKEKDFKSKEDYNKAKEILENPEFIKKIDPEILSKKNPDVPINLMIMHELNEQNPNTDDVEIIYNAVSPASIMTEAEIKEKGYDPNNPSFLKAELTKGDEDYDENTRQFYVKKDGRNIYSNTDKRIVLSSGIDQDVYVEELVEILYKKISTTNPELKQKIDKWIEGMGIVLDENDAGGVRGLELFSKWYTFNYLGYQDKHSEVGEVVQLPEDIVSEFDLIMGGQKDGTNISHIFKGGEPLSTEISQIVTSPDFKTEVIQQDNIITEEDAKVDKPPTQDNLLDEESFRLTPQQEEFFKDSKVRDESGELLKVYHGTTEDFDNFEEGDLGYHFGTQEQANNRIGSINISGRNIGKNFSEGSNIIPAYLNLKNPLRLNDIGEFGNVREIYNELKNNPEFKDVPNPVKSSGKTDSETGAISISISEQFTDPKILKDYLIEKGYDGIVYANKVEGEGDSYIAFKPEQIKSQFNVEPTSDPRMSFRLTPEQEEFFKDSKVRDENGELIKVYHGTNSEDFEVFDPTKRRIGDGSKAIGEGIYFSDIPEEANNYAMRGDQSGRRIIPAYLNIKNPYNDKNPEETPLNEESKEMVRKHFEGYGYDMTKEPQQFWMMGDKALWTKILKTSGYDGVRHSGVYVAFNPEQIKSQFNVEPTSDPRMSFRIEPVDVGESKGTFFISGDPVNLNLEGEQEDFGIRYPDTHNGWAVTKGPATRIKNEIKKGNNVIVITSMSDVKGSMLKNPSYLNQLKLATIKKIGKRKFNSLMKKHNNDIYKVAIDSKINTLEIAKKTAVPDFNQISGKIVAVATVKDIRTGDDRIKKHPAYPYELNFDTYYRLPEPIDFDTFLKDLPDYKNKQGKVISRTQFGKIMASTYNLSVLKEDSELNSKLIDFANTGDFDVLGVKVKAMQFASPQVKEIGLDEALSKIKSKELIDFHRASADLEVAGGLKSTTKSGLGEWETGAEPTIVTEVTGDVNEELFEIIGSMKSIISFGGKYGQETFYNFKADVNGPHTLIRVSSSQDIKDIKKVVKKLNNIGINFKTLPITGNKFDLIVVDEDGSKLNLIKELYNEQEITTTKGKANLIGVPNSRVKAEKVFLDIINKGTKKYPELGKTFRKVLTNHRPRFDDSKLTYRLTPQDPDQLTDEIVRSLADEKKLQKAYNTPPEDKKISIKDIKTDLKAKRFVDKIMRPISSVLKSIHPSLKRALRNFEFKMLTKTRKRRVVVKDFYDKAKDMSKKDYRDLDLAFKNRDESKINELVGKYNLTEEYDNLKTMIDEIYVEGIDSGMEIGWLDDYIPRSVSDLDGLRKDIFNKDPKFQTLYNKLEKQARNKLKRELTNEEKEKIFDNIMRGYSTLNAGKPSNIKKRKIRIVDNDMNKYYSHSSEAILMYIENMTNAIEKRIFLGQSKSDGDAISEYIRKVNEETPLTVEQEQTLKEVLNARFGSTTISPIVGAIKNSTYILTMGSPISAITQLGDLVWAYDQAGVWTTIKTIVSKKKINIEDLGIEKIGQEFTSQSITGKAVDRVFKLVGITKIDKIGKEALINSVLTRYTKEAKKILAGKGGKGRIGRQLQKDIEVYFDTKDQAKINQLIQDLADGNVTEDIQLLVFNKLLDHQPVTQSEMPQKYLETDGGRLFYQLKTFTIRQLDVIRNKINDDIINAKTTADRIRGIGDLIRFAGLWVMAGSTKDLIKDLILNRPVDPEDYIIENLLQLIGANRYQIYQAKRYGFKGLFNRFIAPPSFSVAEDVVGKGLELVTKKKLTKRQEKLDPDEIEKLRGDEVEADMHGLSKYIPLVGKIYFWRSEQGQKKVVSLKLLQYKQKLNKKPLSSKERKDYSKYLFRALEYDMITPKALDNRMDAMYETGY